MHCINKKNPEYLSLLKKSNLKQPILDSYIMVWQEKNGIDKFPTLQELIIKPFIKEGVDFVFEQSPELSKIGTPQQYSQYLDAIFPNSKVKDIVYHTTPNKFDKFDKNFIGKGIGNTTEGVGFYFSNRSNSYEEYKSIVNIKNIEQNDTDLIVKQYEKLEKAKQNLNTYLITKLNTQLDLENIEYINEGKLPLEVYNDYTTFKKLNDDYFNLKNDLQSSAENRSMNEDGISYEEDVLSRAEGLEANFLNVLLNINNPKIFNNRQSLKNNDTLKNNDGTITNIGNNDVQYVVFEPEQIHILSSKKDLEMFKNFINFTKSEYAKYGDIQQFKDYIMSKNFAAVEEFLVVNNKIDRKC